MRINITFIFLLFTSLVLCQEDTTVTFSVKKKTINVFKGVDEKVADWYVYIDEDQYVYLANLFIPVEEIPKWFILRKDSQNLFVSLTSTDQNDPFYTSRKIEPDVFVQLSYTIEGEKLILKNWDFQESYFFMRINVQE